MRLEGWFFIVSLSIPVIGRFSASLRRTYSLLGSWFAAQLEDMKPKGTVASLDGVRAIACLSVVIFHTHIATEHLNLWQRADQPLLSAIFWSGASGVTLFFVLSGFLLFIPYVKALLFENPWPDTRLFYLRRILRIIPGYYFSLFLLVLLSSPNYLQPQNWKHLLLFLFFFMDSFHSTNRLINGPYWTLAIEWQFYLLLPLIALGMRCLARNVTARPERRFWVVFAGLMAMIVWGEGTGLLGHYFMFHPTVTFLVSRPVLNIILVFTYGLDGKYLEDFAVGMLLVLCYTYISHSDSREKYTRWIQKLSPWLLGIGILGLLFMAMRNYTDVSLWVWSIFPRLFQALGWINPLGFSVAYSCCILVILFDTGALKRFFEWAPLRWIGLISYSLYLWHQPILDAFEHAVGPSLVGLNHNVAGSLVYLWEFLVAFPFAFLVYVQIEKPAMRLSDRLRRQRRTRQAQPHGNNVRGEAMIEYRAKQSEGDFSHALVTSNASSYQPFATRASAADGSIHNECPTTGQERPPHDSPSFKVKLVRIQSPPPPESPPPSTHTICIPPRQPAHPSSEAFP
jgi:peptidoglycan/LPS O-acetylase OafA/YrhL